MRSAANRLTCNVALQGFCLIACLDLFAPMSLAADVYRVELADGSSRFASQPLDPSYTLYLRGDSPAKAVAGASAGPTVLEPLIAQYTQKHLVDSALVHALIAVESRFQTHAQSPKGARGPMQLMPQTARRYGVTDRDDPAQNIEAGIHYLKDLLTLHHGNEALALASYNAGEGSVLRHDRRIPPYRETMLYVAAVLARAQTARNLNLP